MTGTLAENMANQYEWAIMGGKEAARIMANELSPSAPRHPNGRFLSVLQNAFVTAYIANGGNGCKAAIEAGYAKKGASNAAAVNLKSKAIVAALEQQREALAARSTITLDRIEEMHVEAYDLAKSQNKSGDMNRAAESLGKMRGAYVDRIEDGRESTLDRFVRMSRELSASPQKVIERSGADRDDAQEIIGVVAARLKNSDSET